VAPHFLQRAAAAEVDVPVSQPIANSLVPQVRAPVLGANLGDTLPQSRVGVSSVHVEGSAALSGIRTVAFRREFVVKLRYLHRNPVKRGLVSNLEDWKWSSYRHYAFREIGIVEIESEWTARDREQKARGGVPRIFLRPG